MVNRSIWKLITNWFEAVTILAVLLLFEGYDMPASATDQGQEPFLKLERVIKLPASTYAAAWSPDSRKLLVTMPYILRAAPNNSASYLIDIKTGEIGEALNGFRMGLEDFFWSPDGKFVAVIDARTVRFFDVPGFNQVGEYKVDIKARQYCSFFSQEGAQFTPDGKGLWVACRVSAKSPVADGKYMVAVKLSVPEFKIVKKVWAPLPRNWPVAREKNAVTAVLRTSLTIQSGKVIQNSILQYKRILTNPKETYRYVIHLISYDLEAEKPFYPLLDVSTLGIKEGRPGHIMAYNPDSGMVAASISVTGKGPSRTASSDIVTYSPSLQKRIAIYSASQQLDSFGIGYLQYTKSGRNLLGMINSKKRSIGVWDAKSLSLIAKEESPKFTWLGLSPDGMRLAGLARRKIYIYKIYSVR